jgi:hypothetical protein
MMQKRSLYLIPSALAQLALIDTLSIVPAENHGSGTSAGSTANSPMDL